MIKDTNAYINVFKNNDLVFFSLKIQLYLFITTSLFAAICLTKQFYVLLYYKLSLKKIKYRERLNIRSRVVTSASL